jgi:hypothetical protein
MHKLGVATAVIGTTALLLASPAQAGGSAVGAGLVGLGVGALLGSALAPREVYVGPPPPVVYYAPPPPPVYYGAVVYGPAPYRVYRHH